jgi:hypothetical protein
MYSYGSSINRIVNSICLCYSGTIVPPGGEENFQQNKPSFHVQKDAKQKSTVGWREKKRMLENLFLTS